MLTGKLYSCGGYGQEKAGLMMVDTATWQAGSVESFGEPPASRDSHSVTSHGARRQITSSRVITL